MTDEVLGLSGKLGLVMSKLPPDIERLLLVIVEELSGDETVGVCLAGSYARGDAATHSDVDLLRFMRSAPKTSAEEYGLQIRGGHLVSITQTTIEQKMDELSRPELAIYAVPGLRQMRVLLDTTGAIADLKAEAARFQWASVQGNADEYASFSLMGYAEEVHKVLSGLSRGDESTVQHGNLGLNLGLAKALVVRRGVLIESENTFFRQAQDTAGRDSEWTRWFRLSSGFEAGPTDEPSFRTQGLAGLRLYVETARLLRPVIRPEHREVIDNALAEIGRSGE